MRRPIRVLLPLHLATALFAGATAGVRAQDGADPGDNPWRDIVFLPESGLAVLLERDPRGVLLDRERYLDLHRRARAARAPALAPDVAERVLLARCEAEGVVEGDRVRWRIRLAVAVRGDAAGTVALPAGGSVIAATVDGIPARLAAAPDGKSLLLSVSGDGLHEAAIEAVAPVRKRGGRSETSFPLPDAEAVRWSLEIPGRPAAGTSVRTSRVERVEGAAVTRITGYPGPKDKGAQAWWREGDEGTDLPPLVGGSVRTLLEVGERAATAVSLVRVEVARRPAASVPISVPAGWTVLGVDSEAPVALGPEEERSVRHLVFAEPFTGTRTVTIRLTRALDGPGALPFVPTAVLGDLPVDARLAVRWTDGLRGVADPGPGTVREEAVPSKEGAVDAQFRAVERGASATVRTERPRARVAADVRAVLDLAEDGPWLAVSFLYRPRGDRIYAVEPRLPPGFAPESVSVSGDLPFVRSLDPAGRLSIVFPGGVDDGGAVAVTLRGRLPVEGWTAEDWAEKVVPLPRVGAGPVDRAEGLLGVGVPPGLEVREEDSGGLAPAPVNDLRESGGFTTEGLTLGYRFEGSVEGGSVRALRRPASYTATAAVLAGPAEDHLRYEAAIAISVQRSGIRELRIRVAPGAGDRLRVEGPDVAERRREAGDGFDTWVVRFARRVREGTVVTLRGDLPLAAGAVAVPIPSVPGAVRTDLLVGLEGGGELEVTADAKGLREADPGDIAGVLGPRAAGLLQSWRAAREGTPSLALRVARLPAAELPPAFADSVRLRTVLGADGVARTRLSAWIRNADRPSLRVALPRGASLHSARVRGEAVRPLAGDPGTVEIPLVRSPEPFEVVIFYEEPADPAAGSASLRAPDLGLPGGPWEWTVRLPDGSTSVETGGDFAAPPPPPATPLLVRWAQGVLSGRVPLPTAGWEKGAPRGGGAPAPMAPAAPALAEEDTMTEAAAPPPAAEAKPRESEMRPAQRIAARATREGLFGMDLRLLEAGPAVTASRLSPGAALTLRWRTAGSRIVGALLAAALALAAAWLARRRGVGTPTWTILALGLLTAAPVALGATDALPWDAAAGATLGFAVFAAVARLHRRGIEKRIERARRDVAARASALRAAGLSLLALLVGAASAPAAEDASKVAPPPGRAPPGSPTSPRGPRLLPPARAFAVYDPDRPATLDRPERVFLPYDRWVSLWNAANPERRIEEARPPVVASASYEARVEDRVLVVFARYSVDAPDGGLVALPPDAALAGVRVDGQPAPVTAAEPGGAVLVSVPKAAAAGARSIVEASIRWPISGREPGGAVKAAIPPVPDCRLVATLPLEDAVVAVSAAGGWSATKSPGATRVEAEIGPLPVLEIRWAPKGADAAGGRLRFEVRTGAAVLLREEGALLAAEFAVEVAAGEMERASVALPPGWEPRSVEGPAVASWTLEGTGTARRLVVRLVGVDAGKTRFVLRAVRPGAIPPEGLAVPDLAVDGAASEVTAVHAAAGRAVRLVAAEASGWNRVEAAKEADALGLDPARGEALQAAWERTLLPARLVLRAEPIARSLECAARSHLYLGRDGSRLRMALDLRPKAGDLFEVRVPLPAGWTLEEVVGGAHSIEEGAVRISFPPPATDARSVALLLRGPAAGDGPFVVPVASVAGATRSTAEVLVATAPGLAATAAQVAGFDPVPVDRFAGWPVLDPRESRSLAYRDARGGGSLAVRREALRATLRPTVISEVTVLEDRAIVDALVVFEVRGGLAGTFRVRAPAGVKDAWVLGEGLREVRTALVEGREVSTVTLQAPASGEVVFRVLYEIPVPAGGEAVVAGVEPLDGEAPRAFLFVRAAGDAEARLGDAPGLDPCDVADLPKVPAGLDPSRILRFFRAREAGWRLPLKLVTHAIAGIPDARIHLVDAVTVVDRDGAHRTRVEARLFNRALAFLPVDLPAGADLESVIAGGVPARPVRRAAAPRSVFVPVRRQSLGEDSQVVSLTYSTRASAAGAAFDGLEPALPSFPSVPVDATTWRLLLPEGRDYSFTGNLDPVAEVEVELSRAEAYASDILRLRKVVAEGSVSQQAVAAENVILNARELKNTLDRAQSRLADLEQAAAEGRVDHARVEDSRKKAQELEREITEALDEVARTEPTRNAATRRVAGQGGYAGRGGEIPPDSRRPEDAPAPQADEERQEAAMYGTREGQATKQWRANFDEKESRDDANERDRRQLEASLGVSVETAGGKTGGKDATVAALRFHSDFDRELGEVGLLQDKAKAGGADGGGGTPMPGGGAGGEALADRPMTVAGALGRGGAGGGGGGAALLKSATGFLNFDGSDVSGDGRVTRIAGVISLAPPLAERGRSYAFRKLDAGAEIRVSPRPADLGRRVGAGAAFALLVGLVFFVRRRRAAKSAA